MCGWARPWKAITLLVVSPTPANFSPPASAELWSSGGGESPVSVQFRGWVPGLDERVSLYLSTPAEACDDPLSQEPLTARVQTAFFGVAPAQAIIQDSMLQALGSLQETEGLPIMFLPVLGQCLSFCSPLPSLCLPDLLLLHTALQGQIYSYLSYEPQGTQAPSVLGTATTIRSL